mmetsp:Transcript_24073/g.60950  ORF Transcript_24073/g.60950 Transcript_24073/m.60950 type:complete len:245 (-) Transcript_24073:366-1100(-)
MMPLRISSLSSLLILSASAPPPLALCSTAFFTASSRASFPKGASLPPAPASPRLPWRRASICLARPSTLAVRSDGGVPGVAAAEMSFLCLESSCLISATCASTLLCSSAAPSCRADRSLCAEASLSSCLSRRAMAAPDLSPDTAFSRALRSASIFLFSEAMAWCCCWSLATSAEAGIPAPAGPCTMPKRTNETTATKTASSMKAGCICGEAAGSPSSCSAAAAFLPAAALLPPPPGPGGAESST